MDRFHSMRVFARVIDEGSFAARSISAPAWSIAPPGAWPSPTSARPTSSACATC